MYRWRGHALDKTYERLKHAKEAFESGNYPYVVRQCQEAVELLLKASLRLVGIEPVTDTDLEIVAINCEWMRISGRSSACAV
jgi:HEPN domain-containing protein